MKDELKEIISKISKEWAYDSEYTHDRLVKAIWNAAVEECAKKAKSKGFVTADFECIHEVDRDSILSLKIEDDENN